MKQPRYDLLMDLVSALRSPKLVRSNFNMNHWATGLVTNPTLECGSAACAAGLGCSLPSWQGAGIRLGKRFGEVIVPIYGDYVEFEALAKMLQISLYLADYFFDSERYNSEEISPLTVANRIRNWVYSNRGV